MQKPSYISNLESEGMVFSVISFQNYSKLYEYWNTKKVTKIYENSSICENGKINPDNVIFKSAQGFLIHLTNQGNEEWSMNIYYKIEQENELKLFSKNLLKQLKDATNHDKRTETKN